MRLIRSALRPANGGLSIQFQQCELKTSNARLCPVLIETSSLVHESKIQCRARSYAASDPSDMPEARKTRRRISKDERKSMVENYVKKYREMNAGKFPNVSDAKKDVGGSYYVVRQILQELQYNSKMSSKDTGDVTSSDKSSVKKDEISINSQEVSDTRELRNINVPISKVDIGDSSSKSYKTKEESQSSISVKASLNDETQFLSSVSDKLKDVGTQSHRLSDEPESSRHFDSENNIKQETIHEDKLKFDGFKPKAGSQESAESEESGRELHKVPTEDAEPQRKSSVWQNLKSFASGILDAWRRS
ncbi:hypothetical protein CDL12_02006 [Handroanthus impetiginosus]|uniref:AT3G52170-like helix-turn-helix domain-containing protein n=1 Tax=Handroanthus impetiginosus TaxID=429701 RepID=A0A2G9I6K5_9LAMI|nr:hypothetical protein CDL12_02006 [Handroanthus impetiginosus]